MPNLTYLTAQELRAKIGGGEISAREAVMASLQRMNAVDSEIRAFLTVTTHKALEQADAIDERRAKGEELPPLAGVPIALKDNMCTTESAPLQAR